MNVLSVFNLKKSYPKGFFLRPHRVLKDVSFELKEGAVTGFIGSNGSGKTTTLKCILNLSFSDSGKIIYFEKYSLNRDIKEKIGFLPEQPYFYKYLTGFEFLKFYGHLSFQFKRKELKDRIHEVLKKVNLFEARHQFLKNYSRGMLQRIGVAQALIHKPKVLILDEPLGGLDPVGRLELSRIIKEEAQRGVSIFFSSHLLHDAEEICDHYVILKSGKVIFSGKSDELLIDSSESYQLTCLKAGKIQVETLKNLEKLQNRIDELRKSKQDILEIKKNRKTLEEAFSQIN